MKKGIFIVLIILIGVVSYFMWPESKETNNQVTTDPNVKTYTNSEYNFSFEYPTVFESRDLYEGINSDALAVFGYVDEALIQPNNDFNLLYIGVFKDDFNAFSLSDAPGGLLVDFDTEKKEWIFRGSNQSAGEHGPQRIEGPIEAYTYASGDITCGWKNVIIPHPDYSYVVELVTGTCDVFHETENGEFKYTSPEFKLTPEELLSTFQFLK